MRHQQLHAGPCRQSFHRLRGGVALVFLATAMPVGISGSASAHLWCSVNAAGSPPTIIQDPVATSGCANSSAAFSVVAGGTGPFTYEWRRNGFPLIDGGAIVGAMTDTLTILAASSEGSFDVVVSNSAGSVTSNAAMLSVACPGDINCNGRITSHDFFTFIAAWVEGQPAGDFNNSGSLDSQDVFDYLFAFFTGC